MWSYKSSELAEHYSSSDGRSYPHTEVADFEAAWNSLGGGEASLGAACADVAKLFVHHLTEEAQREVLKDSIATVPLLAAYDKKHEDNGRAYASSLTCVAG